MRMNIAICTPVRDEVAPATLQCVAALVAESATARPDLGVEHLSRRGGLLDNRNTLAEAALDRGADWLLWIDADMIFPPTTLIRLIGHNLPIVGCNCARRGFPTYPTAARLDARGRRVYSWTTEARARAGAMEAVADLGLGVCLVAASVFAKLPRPFFRVANDPATGQVLGEDVLFFHAARAAGLEVIVDHGLSWEIGHIHGAAILTNADTIAQKAAFHQMQAARLNEQLRRK